MKSNVQKISTFRRSVNGDKYVKNINTLMLSLRIVQGTQFTICLIRKLNLINAQLCSISAGLHIFEGQCGGGLLCRNRSKTVKLF